MEADDRTRTDNLLITNQLLCQLSHIGMMNSKSRLLSSDSDGNRTRVTAVKGRCLNRLTMEPYLIIKVLNLQKTVNMETAYSLYKLPE